MLTSCMSAESDKGKTRLRVTLGKLSVLCFAFCWTIVTGGSLLGFQDVQNYGTFELTAQALTDPSIATITPNELVVREPSGNTTRYQRSARHDTADQQLIGYSSRQAQQVIRWPATNSGRMQIGTLKNGHIEFAWSKMTIGQSSQAIRPQKSPDILPPGFDTPSAGRLRNGNSMPGSAGGLQNLPGMTAMHLSVGNPNERRYLGMQGGNQFGFLPQATGMESAWYIVPVSNNIVRLQQRVQNEWFAIGISGVPDGFARSSRLSHRTGAFGGGAFPMGGSFGGAGAFRPNSPFPISLSPIHNGADQLWQIHTVQGNAGYCFESVLYPGMALTCIPNQGLTLQSMTYDPWQIWWPQTPTFALPQPQFRTVQHQVIPNPPLRPVSARIMNTHSDAIVVLVADRRHSQSMQKLRIPSQGSELVHLDRDPGATIIETVETMDSFGNWNQQQFKTAIPPTVLYDMSVYEEFLQSIAIDRTGKSPNAIEDINYQPRSIGFFLVPPGDEVPEVAEIDAYRIADDAQNPGAVRRLSPRDLQKTDSAPSDPLKDLLKQFQKQRAAF